MDLLKLARIKTELQPHQQRVVDKLRKGNVLVAHGTGSGKTLASIASADAIGSPATVLTPASLTKNYEKELTKHKVGGPKIDIESINTAVLNNKQVPVGNTLIIDEAHGLRNEGTKRKQYIKSQAPNAGRIALLTATPSYNKVTDIAPLINLVKGKKVLPENASDFEKEYVHNIKVQPGFFAKLFGVKPGNIQKLKNEKKLVDIMRGSVDVHEMTDGYPSSSTEIIKTPMSDKQTEVYNYVLGKVPWHIRYKIKAGLPVSKQEAKSLNSFLTGARQASVSYGPYVDKATALEAGIGSPKLVRAVDELKARIKENPKFRALVYSNWLDAGMKPMAALLDKANIPYGEFHGGLNAAQKKEIVERYNNGKLPVILGSSSAGEGLDLKGTRLIQLLDPHFNEGKIKQIVGRGIRYKSHDHLPEKDRNVLIQRYFSHPKPGLLSRIGLTSKDPGTEEWIYDNAKRKQLLINRVKELMRRASEAPSEDKSNERTTG
jgi:SNF2 family DNA or RNA helicase